MLEVAKDVADVKERRRQKRWGEKARERRGNGITGLMSRRKCGRGMRRWMSEKEKTR